MPLVTALRRQRQVNLQLGLYSKILSQKKKKKKKKRQKYKKQNKTTPGNTASWAVMVHTFNPRTQEAEAGESEFKASLVYRVSFYS